MQTSLAHRASWQLRIFAALPQLLVTAIAVTSGLPRAWSIAYFVAASVSVLVSNRANAMAFGQLLGGAAAATPAIVWLRLQEDALPSAAVTVALIVLPLVFVRRLWAAPLFERTPDDALLLLCLIAFGFSELRWRYVVLAIACVVCSLLVRQGPRVLRRALTQQPAAMVGCALLVLVLGAAFGGGLNVLFWATGRRQLGFGAAGYSRTGLTDSVRLDSGPISQSDQVMLRVFGKDPAYLQGDVLDSFDGIRWTDSRQLEPAVTLEGGPTPQTQTLRVVALAPQRKLPVPAHTIVSARAQLARRASGGIATVDYRYVDEWFAAAGDDNAYAPVSARDLHVVRVLRQELRALAERWAANASTDAERAELLATHLKSEYRYSLKRPATPRGTDRLADFLFVHREGHCEYFATAQAVLLRSLGIPARVVTGFRVDERNRYGNFYTVRAKHAHSWVIYWDKAAGVAGEFRRIDPTPGLPIAERTAPSKLGALFDYLRERGAHLYEVLGRSPELLAGILATVALLLFVLRGVLQRRRTNLRARGGATGAAHLALAQLLAQLAACGFDRDPASTLHALAERLAAAQQPELAESLRKLALLRYAERHAEYHLQVEAALAHVRALPAATTE